MTGAVNEGLEAIIRIAVLGPTGRRLRIRAAVDTGFNETLSLPASIIAELELPWARRGSAELADGKTTIFDVYWATVFGNRRRLRVHVDEADTTTLIGMELMVGSEMRMDIIPGDSVRIRPLRGRQGDTRA
jgi:clan AA aspartic protease